MWAWKPFASGPGSHVRNEDTDQNKKSNVVMGLNFPKTIKSVLVEDTL